MKLWLLLPLLVISHFGLSQSGTGFMPVEEFKIYYKIYGKKGKPVLIINGGPGFSSNYLDLFAEEMAKEMDRKVIIFDPRGTGKSVVKPVSKRTINLRNQVSDIDSLRKFLDIKKWDVIGHAYGGAIAMLYAKKHEKNINKMVLSSSIGMDLSFVDPMIANLETRLSSLQKEELEKIKGLRAEAKLSSSQFFKKRFDLMAPAFVYDQTKIEEAREMISLESDFNHHVNQVLWDEIRFMEYDVATDMKEFDKPVLIIHGRQDVIGESVPIYSNSIFPNSNLVFFNEAGRYLWLDQKELYFKYLSAFLN